MPGMKKKNDQKNHIAKINLSRAVDEGGPLSLALRLQIRYVSPGCDKCRPSTENDNNKNKAHMQHHVPMCIYAALAMYN